MPNVEKVLGLEEFFYDNHVILIVCNIKKLFDRWNQIKKTFVAKCVKSNLKL